jgi:hypothetical protein
MNKKTKYLIATLGIILVAIALLKFYKPMSTSLEVYKYCKHQGATFVCTPQDSPFLVTLLEGMTGCEWKYTEGINCRSAWSGFPGWDPNFCAQSHTLTCGRTMSGSSFDVTDCIVKKDTTGTGGVEVARLKVGQTYTVPANSNADWTIDGYKCPQCTEGWTNEYRCYGQTMVQRKYQRTDCSYEWRNWQDCSSQNQCINGNDWRQYYCLNGGCNAYSDTIITPPDPSCSTNYIGCSNKAKIYNKTCIYYGVSNCKVVETSRQTTSYTEPVVCCVDSDCPTESIPNGRKEGKCVNFDCSYTIYCNQGFVLQNGQCIAQITPPSPPSLSIFQTIFQAIINFFKWLFGLK